MRTRCPFCLEPFSPPADEPRFVRHLRHRHGWDKTKARRFIAAESQTAFPDWREHTT